MLGLCFIKRACWVEHIISEHEVNMDIGCIYMGDGAQLRVLLLHKFTFNFSLGSLIEML